MGIVRLRPHHILCNRFLPLDKLDRGEDFAKAANVINGIMRQELGSTIIFSEGPDRLCVACPSCNNDRCENAFGNEDKIRRWDARILEGLGVSYGQELSADVLNELITRRAPFEFCTRRCPWKTVCGVFGSNKASI